MACVCSRFSALCDWLILGHYSPMMPTGRIRSVKTKAKSHNKELVNLKRLIFTGRSQTLASPY